MKKIILLGLCWPLFSYPIYAQKENKKDDSQEVIIIKSRDKEKKITLETKDGELFINGKPSSEFKDGDVDIIRQKVGSGKRFHYTPGADHFNLFDKYGSGDGKAFLGVTTEKIDGGVKVKDVSKGSPAEKAGLKEGDVITKIGNKNIAEEDDVFEAINNQKPKDDIAILYTRDGKSAEAKATLSQRSFSRSFALNGNHLGEGFSNRIFNGTHLGEGFGNKMSQLGNIPNGSFSYSFGKGRLGLRIEDSDDESGALVTEVHDESAAAKAGLKENDVITEVNGKKVKDVSEVRKELSELKDKNSYNIKAKRNGAEMNFEIKIPKKTNKADI